MSIPSRRATEERTWLMSSFSPSISLLFENIFSQGLQHCFLLQLEAEAFHAANQPTLPVTQMFCSGPADPSGSWASLSARGCTG